MTHTVEVRDNKFCSTGEQECSGTGVPHDLFIDKPGDSVVWEWIDTLNIHNVTECTEGWSACGPDVHESNPIGASPTQTEGDHGPIQFGETGIFYYRCTIHPSQMTGRVFVGVTPAPTPSPGPETPTPTPTPDGDLWGTSTATGRWR